MSKQEWCRFCGRHAREVGRLFTGPDTAICNECVTLFQQMMEQPPTGTISFAEFRAKVKRMRDTQKAPEETHEG